MSQKLEVKDFKIAANDPAATQYAVKDFNGNNCALVIVGLALDGIEFEGNVIKQERKPNGEYWVYITDGSMEFQINSKDYLPEPVDFVKLGITKVEGGRTYRMNVEHPNLEKSFDDLYAEAQDFVGNKNAHSDFGYFESANLALKAAFEHNDCPPATREEIRAQRNDILAIRNHIYRIEHFAKKAKQYETENGFNDHRVYERLASELIYIDSVLIRHPEMSAMQELKNTVNAQIMQHPDSQKEDGTETVIRHRETLSGTVSFKDKSVGQYMDLSRMRIFASSSPNIKEANSRIIGKVNEDGTYSVVKPDDIKPLYIYATGEKDDAHYIADGVTTYDIVIKTNK